MSHSARRRCAQADGGYPAYEWRSDHAPMRRIGQALEVDPRQITELMAALEVDPRQITELMAALEEALAWCLV